MRGGGSQTPLPRIGNFKWMSLFNVTKKCESFANIDITIWDAASSGNVEVLSALIQDRGLDPDVSDALGSTALLLAVTNFQLDAVHFLLTEGKANPNQRSSGIGSVPLITAVTSGQEAVMNLLLEAGADANAADADGRTALHYCCREGYSTFAKALIDAGADVDARTLARQETPLMWATMKGNYYCAETLLQGGALSSINESLRIASEQSHNGLCQLLLQYGADKLSLDTNGQNAVGLASNNLSGTRSLLKNY